jgi:RNA polymerase sigma factor (sigma-70 family)
MIGLVEAAKRFDGSRGTKFITYAAWWIRKRILRALAEQPQVVRLSGYQAKIARRGNGANPVIRPRVIPLDVEPREGARPVGERLRDPAASPEESVLRDEASDLIREEVARLTLPEQRVLALRFGFASDTGLTLQEAGERLSLSRERVRQIEARAIARLRRAVSSRHERPRPRLAP